MEEGNPCPTQRLWHLCVFVATSKFQNAPSAMVVDLGMVLNLNCVPRKIHGWIPEMTHIAGPLVPKACETGNPAVVATSCGWLNVWLCPWYFRTCEWVCSVFSISVTAKMCFSSSTTPTRSSMWHWFGATLRVPSGTAGPEFAISPRQGFSPAVKHRCCGFLWW